MNFSTGILFRYAEEAKNVQDGSLPVQSEGASRVSGSPTSQAEGIKIAEVYEVNAKDSRKAVHPSDRHRCYPKIPYYAPLRGLDLQIDVNSALALPFSDPHSINRFTFTKCIPQFHEALCDVIDRFGTFSYISNTLTSIDDPMLTSKVALAVSTKCCSVGMRGAAGSFLGSFAIYEVYLHALMELFQRMSQLRQGCCNSVRSSDLRPDELLSRQTEECEADSGGAVTHHVVYLRIIDHAVLKDVNVMLAIENCRMVLYVSTSSRVTQQYLSAQAQKMLLEIQWFSGATLVCEPDHLQPDEINPVFVLWDVLMNMPLTLPFDLSDAVRSTSTETAKSVQDTSSYLAAAATQVLEGFVWTILSSVPFSGAHRCTSILRFQGSSELKITPDDTKSSYENVGQRYLWRLVSSFGNFVLPSLVTHLVQRLIDFEYSGERLHTFTLKTHVDDKGKKLLHEKFPNHVGLQGTRGTGMVGLSYIHSEYTGLTTQRGPSSQSWIGFSRLSGNSWLTDEERQQLGLIIADEYGEIILDCEFKLNEIRYRRNRVREKSVNEGGLPAIQATPDKFPAPSQSRESHE